MIAALLLVSSPMAHISMNPNYGAASGGYFMATMKIPHGERGMHSTKFVLHVPRGVATVRPEVPMGWSVDMQMYDRADATSGQRRRIKQKETREKRETP